METKLPVADSSPYPAIQVQSPSAMYARAVTAGLGGGSSEMSTITQYIYSFTVLAQDFPCAADYFHKIAVVEMRHLAILSELVLKLGGDPRLWSFHNGRPAYWNAAVLTYSHELPVLLNRALTGENRAIAEYQRMEEHAPDPAIKAVFQRLILDEKKHVAIFTQLMKEASHNT